MFTLEEASVRPIAMKVFVALLHSEHESFNGAMFRTTVETLASAGHEAETSDLHAMQFDHVSGRHNATRRPFHCRRTALVGPSMERVGVSWFFRMRAGTRELQQAVSGERWLGK
jgi:putative NADPH-quinone reductase